MEKFEDIVIAVTYQCNARCRFCHIWKEQKSYSIQPSAYQKLPLNLKNVNISGGEPFLREDLPEIIRNISRRAPRAKLIISTNGFAPSLIKKQTQKIIKFKRDIGVAVSLDGFGQAHEELRGVKGGYSLALETIRLLKELGLKDLKVAFTLNDQNINQLKKVYRFSRESGLEFSLALVHNSAHYFHKVDNQSKEKNRMKKELLWLIDQEMNSWSPKRWLRAYFTRGLIYFLEKNSRLLPDYSGRQSLFIDPFGAIYPSDVWDLLLGQLNRINNWSDFYQRSQKIMADNQRPASWMICTARQAIRRHWAKAAYWILKEKIRLPNFCPQRLKPLVYENSSN